MDTKYGYKNRNVIIFLLLLVMYIFFSTVNIYINFCLLILMFIYNVITLSRFTKFNKDYTVLLWILFTVMCLFSLLSPFNVNVKNGIIFILCSSSFLLSYINLSSKTKDWVDECLKLLFIFSLIFALGTLIQIFLPSAINLIKRFYIKQDKIALSMSFIDRESLYSGYNGLVVQTGTNAFLLCIFIGLSFYKLILSDKKCNWKYIIFIALGFILLILTGKRTLLIASMFSFVMVFLLFKKFNVKYVFIISIASIIFVFFTFFYTNIGDKIIQKFTVGENYNLSGREVLYEKMINNFKKNPIGGVGIDSKVDGQDGHNIYLQVASETGIMGITVFLVFLIRNLWINFRYLMHSNQYKAYFVLTFYIQLIFIIWGLTGNVLYDQFVLITYFLILAINTHLINKIKGEMSHEESRNINFSK